LDGQLALGAGMTYQYDGSKGTTLGLATYTWHDDHYELAAIRFFSAQTRRGGTLADPNWVFEFSRRWACHPAVSNHETDADWDVVEVVKRWRAWFRRQR